MTLGSPCTGSMQTVTRPRAQTSMQLVLIARIAPHRPSAFNRSFQPVAQMKIADLFGHLRILLENSLLEAPFAHEDESGLQPFGIDLLHVVAAYSTLRSLPHAGRERFQNHAKACGELCVCGLLVCGHLAVRRLDSGANRGAVVDV